MTKRIVTRWSEMNYRNEGVAMDLTMLFSEEINEGFDIEQISTAVDCYGDRRVLVVTALLSR